MNIPNSISILRLMLIPTFVIVFFMPDENSYKIAGCIFLLSGITDFLDGYIARKCGLVTDLGKVLDPLADKLTQFTVFCCLWIKKIIPFWIVAVYMAKEIIMFIGGSSLYNRRKIVVASKWYGKVATTLFYAGVLIVLITDLPDTIKRTIVIIALAATLLACILYAINFFKVFFDKRENNTQKSII